MKVLQFPSYITINEYKQFSRSITGYGYMTIAIAASVSKKNTEVDLITQSNITNGFLYKNVNILRRTWWNIFSNINISYFWMAFRIIFLDRIPLKIIPNYMIYYLSMGYFENVLKNKSYDLVHIHGIGPSTLPIINVCNKNKIKYLVTLHGLNSFNDSIIISAKHKQIEKEFIKLAEQENIPVTVISSGIKKKILNYLNISDSRNFVVIPNGCNTKLKIESSDIDIRKQYNISKNKFIMLCVGNIISNKNQIQIVHSFSLLPKNIQKQFVVLFLGMDNTNGTFKNDIMQSGNSESLICCGSIPKKNIQFYYSQADCTVVVSKSEGFGLPMIEGFTSGLPCLAFSDLDAVPDLYHEKAMILVNKRTDEALAAGLTEMLLREWDKDFIKEYAQNFSLDQMSEKYITVYEDIINEHYAS